MNPLVVDRPALPTQQHVDALVTVPNTHLGELLDPAPQRVLGRAPGLVPLHRPRLTDNEASSPLADPVVTAQVEHCFATLRRLHHFFFAMSVNIALSRLRSATIFFSLAFSSRNCLSSRAWPGSRPPYSFFQR